MFSSCGTKIPAADTSYIKVEKSGCLGPCKVYTVSIYENGFCSLIGRDKIPSLGSFEGKLSKKEVKALWQQVEEAKLFEMEDQYGYGGNDAQAVFLTFSNGTEEKKIRYKHAPPLVLKRVAQAIEAIVLSEDWQRVEQ
jgi:hypothetical protein